MSDSIKERAHILEEKFFAAQEAKALNQLRTDLLHSDDLKALAAVAHINDRDALEELEAIGVTPSTFVAVKLIPMVAVAWADDDLEDEEIEAIQKAAAEFGIVKDSPSGQLLHQWLRSPLSQDVIDAWALFVSAYCRNLDKTKIADFEKETIDSAIEVAEAAGGFLGLGAVSRIEEQMIERLRNAFR